MSTGSLQPHEQELLSALLDDELTEAEHVQAQKLLQRAEAREYLSQLSAGRELVKRHAKARAPVGFSARVMSALEGGFDDVSRPVNNQVATAGKVHQLGSFSWRTPLFAAAAVVVVSMGMIFGPQLWKPQGAQGDGIAREVLEQGRGGTPDEVPAEVKKPVDELLELHELLDKTGDGNWVESRADENFKRLRRDATDRNSLADPAEDAAEDAADQGSSVPESQDASRSLQPMQTKKDAGTNETGRKSEESKHPGTEAEGKSDAVGLGGGVGGGGARTGKSDGANEGATEAAKRGELRRAESPPTPSPAAPAELPKPGNSTVEQDPAKPADHDAKARDEAGKQAGTQADADKEAKPGTGGGYGDGHGDDRGENHGDGAGRAGSPRASASPKVSKGGATDRQNDDAGEQADGTAAEIVTLSLIDEDDILAAMADVLWVANLYGDVGLNDDDAVVIDLDTSSKQALLAALRKLAIEQKYGSLDLDATKLADPAADTANGPAGFVPAERAKAGAEAERIRLVVRLK